MNLSQEKKNIIDKLSTHKITLKRVQQDFKVDVTELIKKVDKAIKSIEDDFFSIAFFGSYSDGKSTILSVLTDNLEIEISPEPKTENIHKYPYGDFLIIDTPGLDSDNFRHDEITKKYISEANIVIYTVDATNPIKHSHHSTVKWIMKDLQKLESTIIVANKMDLVADLEDDEDFNQNAEIKKEVVNYTLKRLVNHNGNFKICCVAANPYDKDLEEWSKNKELYNRLSRIKSLESTIYDFIELYKEQLLIDAGVSVVRDTTNIVLADLDKIKKSFEVKSELLDKQIKEFNSRIDSLESDITRGYVNIKKDIISLRDDIIVELNSVDKMEELANVIQKRLGKDGYILQEQIDLIIRNYTNNLLTESKEFLKSLEETLVYHSKFEKELFRKLSSTGKNILKGILSRSTRTIANGVLKLRDIIKIPFKFKPWGAVKFAKYLKAMPVALEALEFASDIWQKWKLDKKRKEIKSEILESFKDFIEDLDQKKYTETYFPFVAETRKILNSLEKSRSEIQKTIINIDKISSELNTDGL